MTVTISDDDIAFAERILLPTGCVFNDERRAFISCLESRDVVACPGSGKTTALLAKLLILARKMPFYDGSGICVLTHTNVAIDEIMTRAGSLAGNLFTYPNYFGTIQKFVDTFLTVPFFKSEYRVPVLAIDNSRFFSVLEKAYKQEYSLQQWLEPKNKGKGKSGIKTLGHYWFQPSTLNIGKDLDNNIDKLSEATATYKKINDLRRTILESGVLSYHDAYSLGLRYIHKNPDVISSIRKRFTMIFIDEAQDTEDHQLRILNTIFPPRLTNVQRLGDPNQAIFQSASRVHTDNLWEPAETIHFSDTKRYGGTICKILNTIRVDSQVSLKPNESVGSFPAQLLVFQPGNEKAVLPAFCSLVKATFENNQNEIEAPIYKAIGWIGKDKTLEGKLCLVDYFPSYEKPTRVSAQSFPNLLSYILDAKQRAHYGGKEFSFAILNGLAHALELAGIKSAKSARPYTATTLTESLQAENPALLLNIKTIISKAFLEAVNSRKIGQSLRAELKELLLTNWKANWSEIESFFNGQPINLSAKTLQPLNQFVSEDGINIQIGTVHSVKGEEHTATLFLETYYQRKTDGERLIEFLKGHSPEQQLRKAYHKQNLKIAHVAFSRPTHLLAFACRTTSIAGHEANLANNGWCIRKV